MIYTRPFEVSDFAAFEPIEPLRQEEIKDPEFAQAIEDSGLAVTGIRSGEIIGCGGVHPTDNDTVGELWLRLSSDCLTHKIDTLRWLKEGLEIIEEVYPFEQLNATIQRCFGRSLKMIERMGFKRVREVTIDEKKWFIYTKRVR